MNEHQIELMMEHKINKLDDLLMNGRVSQEEYDHEMRKLSTFADNLYKLHQVSEDHSN